MKRNEHRKATTVPGGAGAKCVSGEEKESNQKYVRITEFRTTKFQFHFWKKTILKRFGKILVNKPY